MAKQKKQYDNTNDIVLDVWRSVLLGRSWYGASGGGGGLPVAAMSAWLTLAGANGIFGNSGHS